MWRRLLNFASAASLLLCAAVIVLWVRSYWQKDVVVEFQHDGARWAAASEFGRLWLGNDPQLEYDLRALREIRTEAEALREEAVTVTDAAQREATPVNAGSDREAVRRAARARAAALHAAQTTSRTINAKHDALMAQERQVLSQIQWVPGMPRPLPRTSYVVPHWLAVVATMFLPMSRWSLIAYRRRAVCRRATLGLCRECGYDLRASPGRCPECGNVGGD